MTITNVRWVFDGCEDLKSEVQGWWQRKQPRIERLLTSYRDELVEIRLTVSRHERTKSLELRAVLLLPTGTLVADARGSLPTEIVDCAVDKLVREIKRHKHHVKRDDLFRRRREHRRNLSAAGSYLERDQEERRRRAFFELLEPMLPAVYDYARHHVQLLQLEGVYGDREVTTRDLVDDVMLRAWEQYGTRPTKLDLDLWLMTLVRQRVDELRQPAPAESLSEDSDVRLDEPLTPETDVDETEFWLERIFERTGPATLEELVPDAHTNSAWDEVEDADQQQRVDQALSRLPHDQREVLLLFAEGAFEIEEIAKIVDKTPSDVQQLLDSARTQLREQLAEMFEPEPASV